MLASASPRRAALLRSIGVDPVIAPVDCDERWIAGETPIEYTRRLAGAKAALADAADAVVLAADTTVWIDPDREPLGKPADREEARAMLRALMRAEVHQVTTAFAIVDRRADAPVVRRGETTTRVWMRSVDDAALERHLDAEEWWDKAGGYAIQGLAAGLVRRIDGSYTGVVGLPLAEVAEALEALDPIEPRAPRDPAGAVPLEGAG